MKGETYESFKSYRSEECQPRLYWLDESSLRAIATVVNNKIAEQDEEKADAIAEAAREALAENMEDES